MAQTLASNGLPSDWRTQDTGHDMYTQRATAFVPSARDLQIVDSTLSVVGGDVHNHYYHVERPGDIWGILRLIPNFRNIYQDMLSKVTPGTGMWLVKGDKFGLWLEPNGDIKIFWGSEIPGAGKTLLASIVIERLEALRRESDAAICVCYVYFRYSDRSEVTVRNVLEILVKQTLERHPECRALIERSYAQHLRENSAPSEVQLLGLIRELINCMACTFYVLDALDEAPTRVQLAIVRTLVSLNVKLFITSRPLKTVEAKFPQAHVFSIIAQDVDIDLHIAKAIDESADLQRLLGPADSTLREDFVSTIKQNCGGMFLHASLQLDALAECASAHAVRRTLKAFPSRIEDAYPQTWDRILKQNADYVSLAKAVLVWVLNASRSMTVKELERAVATCPDTHRFELDRLVPGTTLVSLCRGLVTVEEDSQLVRLVHYTAKNTLMGLLHESFPRPHSLLASVCMTHLGECGFQNTTISSEEGFKAALKEDPLLAYASEAWALHARESLDDDDSKHRTAKFITESVAFPAFTNPSHSALFDILTPHHILALYRLPMGLIQDTVVGNPDVATQIKRQSPIMVASRVGYEDFVARLIGQSEIQANLVDTDGWPALMLAACSGHEGIVRLLLALPDIQINLVNNEGYSALMMACRYGHVGTVALLLARREIQVNLFSNGGSSALLIAACHDVASIVALLVAHPDIQLNMSSSDGFTALLFAASAGRVDIVKILLAHPDTQVNRASLGGLTALLTAASEGRVDVVKTLLTHRDIQVNLTKDSGWSALMRAAVKGHEDIVKLLLAHPDIQINQVDDKGWTALTLAARKGHEGVVGLLLAHPGIQVNLCTSSGSSALTLASEYGHEGVVALLVAHPKMQINHVNSDGWSSLMLAAYEGRTGVVGLLLAHPEIRDDLVDSEGWSALLLAVSKGREGVVKLLLAHPKIQVNQVKNDGWSALMLAANNGYAGVVGHLIAHPEIQVNLVKNHGSSALLLAAEFGYKAIVELLLTAHDINVNASDGDGDTPIKLAAKGGHEAIVRMLLDMPNVEITIRSTGDGHTAMSTAHANGHTAIVDLLRDFELQKEVPPVEDGSDSDRSESYYDAEEGD